MGNPEIRVSANVTLHLDPDTCVWVNAYHSDETGKYVLTIADRQWSLTDFNIQSPTREQLEVTLTEALEAVRAIPEPAPEPVPEPAPEEEAGDVA